MQRKTVDQIHDQNSFTELKKRKEFTGKTVKKKVETLMENVMFYLENSDI